MIFLDFDFLGSIFMVSCLSYFCDFAKKKKKYKFGFKWNIKGLFQNTNRPIIHKNLKNLSMLNKIIITSDENKPWKGQ